MNLARLTLFSLVLVLIIWAIKGYADSVQLTTYYPAPTGYYTSLQVQTTLRIPCTTSGPQDNKAYVDTSNNSLYVSKSSCP